MKPLIGIDLDETIVMWPEDNRVWENLSLTEIEEYPGSSEIVQNWVKDGISVAYITFRSLIYKEDTLAWLRLHNFPNPENIYFGYEYMFKSDIVKKLGAVGMIDDDIEVIQDCINKRQLGFWHDFKFEEYLVDSKLFLPWKTWESLDKLVRHNLLIKKWGDYLYSG